MNTERKKSKNGNRFEKENANTTAFGIPNFDISFERDNVNILQKDNKNWKNIHCNIAEDIKVHYFKRFLHQLPYLSIRYSIICIVTFWSISCYLMTFASTTMAFSKRKNLLFPIFRMITKSIHLCLGKRKNLMFQGLIVWDYSH